MNQASQLRLESCLSVIRQVSGYLSGEDAHGRIVDELSRLDELLSLIDTAAVTESDLERIESSTNQLMNEIASLFDRQAMDPLFDNVRH